MDANEHLVNQDGLVIHPGTDAEYQFTHLINDGQTGEVVFQLQDAVDITVEGQVYNVLPYIGYFTPTNPNSPLEGIGANRSYKAGVGIVLSSARFVSAPIYVEDRLVYYELN